MIQGRSFNADDGSLFYPDTREFFDGFTEPYIPDSPVSPIWNPEFFGNMMVVNSSTWPYLEVEPRRYRFRLLNGCNSRFLILQFDQPGVEVWQIGAEGSFPPAPVRLNDHPYPGSSGGATEEWVMYNVTEDAHPIHIHLVQFQVLGRQAIGGGPSVAGSNDPLPWETGFKDTVIAYPGEITRVKARFDIPGFYVWHCHIVEHEDNEMMRPYHVGPVPPGAPAG